MLMTFRNISCMLLLGASGLVTAADTVTEYLLDDVDSGDGSWPCLFYEMNYNTELAVAERKKWYGPDEDESYWREGRGPFSIDGERFLVTHWQSSLHPLLVRRHFTLDADDLDKISVGTVTLTYSYDENPKFWLNGTLLTSASGWNDDNYATLNFNLRFRRLLKEGDNLLCVSLQQGDGGGHIDYGLYVKYDPTKTAIGTVEAAEEEALEPVFNLLGQQIAPDATRLGTSAKGILITRNKKIFRK